MELAHRRKQVWGGRSECSLTGDRVSADAEEHVLHRQEERKRTRIPSTKLDFVKSDGATNLRITDTAAGSGHAALLESLGTCDDDFALGLINQIGSAVSKGPETDEQAFKLALATMRGIQPRDEAEAMLAAQMAAIHKMTMTFARRLNHSENIQQQESASNALNKFARTYVAQLTALKTYRTGGEQRVTVQHVNVNQGGQAIVGEVHHGSRGAGAGQKRKD